eukprot:scaffold183537_cov22-Tisochrysis_lutea.AAC.1
MKEWLIVSKRIYGLSRTLLRSALFQCYLQARTMTVAGLVAHMTSLCTLYSTRCMRMFEQPVTGLPISWRRNRSNSSRMGTTSRAGRTMKSLLCQPDGVPLPCGNLLWGWSRCGVPIPKICNPGLMLLRVTDNRSKRPSIKTTDCWP